MPSFNSPNGLTPIPFLRMGINENHIEIKFFDFEITHAEITRRLNLQPTNFWVMGDKYLMGSADVKIEKNRNNNFWGHELKTESNDWIGELANKFIDEIIVPRIKIIKELTDVYHGEFSIVQYMYDGCNPGLYFNKRQMQILSDCGLELNIDIYVLYGAEKIR
jgi:hypothetical protein